LERSGGWPQHNAMRDFTDGNHAPEGDEQLAGKGNDHFRLACTAGSLGPGTEPLGQSAVFLKQQKPPGELDHASPHTRIGRLGQALFAAFRSAFVRRASLHPAILAQVTSHPDATIAELSAWLVETHKVAASTGLMNKTLAALDLTYKKSPSTLLSKRARTLPRHASNGASSNPR
jgi:hypothetical protein